MEENNLIPFVAQWMTIQPSLFVRLDDELGELDEDQKTFVAFAAGPCRSGTSSNTADDDLIRVSGEVVV